MAIVDFGTQTNASQDKWELESLGNEAGSRTDTEAKFIVLHTGHTCCLARRVAEDSPLLGKNNFQISWTEI